MTTRRPLTASLLALCLAATGAVAGTASATALPARTSVDLRVLGTYATGVFDESAAEITAHDPRTQRLFVVNAQSGSIDVLDVRNPAAPARVGGITVAGLRAADGSTVAEGSVVNSVDVKDGVLAVAVEAPDKVSPGWVAFYATRTLAPRSAVRVGSLPDMLTFSPDGRTVLVANEGEPADDFSSDPEGSVALVDVSGGVNRLRQSAVRTAGFGAYDNGTALPDGVRVFGPDVAVPAGLPAAGRVARNLEPEYVAVSPDSRTAYVSLQEANAIAVVDVRSGAVTDVWPIPLKDWSAPGVVLDPSDRDGGIESGNWPVYGLAMPDAIATYQVRGETYLVAANEGDAREWGDYVEPARVKDDEYVLCADVFGDAEALKEDEAIGRLNVSTGSGLREGEGCYEEIHAFGGRSISIFSADGELVSDTGSMVEGHIASLIESGELPEIAWNANHSESPSFDNRSDDKGPEPEGVTTGTVLGRTYAFVTLERVGGVMVVDVTDPRAPFVADYVNNRNWDAEYDDAEGAAVAGDLGPEGAEFIPAGSSPTGQPVLAVANEVSGTTTLYAVDRVRIPPVRGPQRP